MIRVIIADDEPPARDRIRRLIQRRDDCQIIAECADGQSTLDALLTQPAEVIFLDIQMPVLTGFEVLAALPDAFNHPAIVFATAYDQHALKAFEVAAVDYLLKPYNPARFHAALDRAIELSRSRSDASADHLQDLLRQVSRHADFRIPVRDGDHLLFVRAQEVDYIEAAGNYLIIHLGNATHIHRETMTSMESRLASLGFFRLNRSALVNLSRVREISTSPGSPHRVILENDTVLPLTRPLRELQQALTNI
jgi:two-component system LytT family response regulator